MSARANALFDLLDLDFSDKPSPARSNKAIATSVATVSSARNAVKDPFTASPVFPTQNAQVDKQLCQTKVPDISTKKEHESLWVLGRSSTTVDASNPFGALPDMTSPAKSAGMHLDGAKNPSLSSFNPFDDITLGQTPPCIVLSPNTKSAIEANAFSTQQQIATENVQQPQTSSLFQQQEDALFYQQSTQQTSRHIQDGTSSQLVDMWVHQMSGVQASSPSSGASQLIPGKFSPSNPAELLPGKSATQQSVMEIPDAWTFNCDDDHSFARPVAVTEPVNSSFIDGFANFQLPANTTEPTKSDFEPDSIHFSDSFTSEQVPPNVQDSTISIDSAHADMQYTSETTSSRTVATPDVTPTPNSTPAFRFTLGQKVLFVGLVLVSFGVLMAAMDSDDDDSDDGGEIGNTAFFGC